MPRIWFGNIPSIRCIVGDWLCKKEWHNWIYKEYQGMYTGNRWCLRCFKEQRKSTFTGEWRDRD